MFGTKLNVVLVTSLIFLSPSLHAGMRTLTWDSSPGATEYHLYYGSSSDNYTDVIHVGGSTQTTVDLDDCTRWFFAVTASNSAGESGFSTEVDWLTPMSVDDFAGSGQSVYQGFQGSVTITGARFQPGAVLELDYPGWTCPSSASQSECDAALAERKSAVRLENVSIDDCNTVTAWANFDSTTPGAAPTAGEYTLTVTNTDGSSATLDDAVEILVDPARRDLDKTKYWTDNRIDGLDLGWIKQALPSNQPCTCCADATCPSFQHQLDIDGDGWIDGNDLALVYTDHFGLCWDNSSNPNGATTWPWTDQACRTHPSETQ